MFEIINCWNNVDTLIDDEYIIDQLCDAELDYKTTKFLFQTWVRMVHRFGYDKLHRPKGLELIFSSETYPVRVLLNNYFLPEHDTPLSSYFKAYPYKEMKDKQIELFLTKWKDFVQYHEYVAIRKLGVVTVDKVYCLTINMMYSPTLYKNGSKCGRIVKTTKDKAIVEIYCHDRENYEIEYQPLTEELKSLPKHDVVIYWENIPLLLPDDPLVPYWEDIKHDPNPYYYDDVLHTNWS